MAATSRGALQDREGSARAVALLLGSGPLVTTLASTLDGARWSTTRATEVPPALHGTDGALPRAILLQPVDLHEASALLRDVARLESARGIPLLAVLAEAPRDPEDLPTGADAYLVDPSADDLLQTLARHVVAVWSRQLSGQHALDIIESLEDGLLVVDRGHRIVYHNGTGLALVQRTTRHSGPLLGSLMETAMPAFADERVQRALHAGLEEGEGSSVEVSIGDVRLSLAVFPNPDGATLIARDVTTRQRLEDALLETRMRLVRSERAAFLSELVSGVAHEVRTPLVSLGNNLELIRTEMKRHSAAPSVASATAIEVNIEQAWAAWDRAVRIMKELQRITRLDPSVRDRIDLSAAIQDAVALFGAMDRRAARVATSFAPGLFVHGDVRKLQQVILNLLQNAVEATEGSREPVEVLTRLADPGHAELVVRDAGRGMTSEVVAHMFDPLFTTKPSATGLGLGVVHRVVQDHGGRIACETAPGRGSTFTITLPLMQEATI